ncbi:MAG: hypothetical protein GY862_00840 [Gammaproteobacteria bacterium]|nr:hypothetical protein [Gammaproteobacteria bacterium]
MELLLNWIDMIPRETAKSRALPGRRKSGKSAIMQRLFNILWDRNGAVIPFYFEMDDCDQWLLEFVDDYYRTFVSQYLSFQTRIVLEQSNEPWKFSVLREMAREIKDDKLLKDMDCFQEDLEAERADQAMYWAFSAPGRLAGNNNAFALVMIDEIQYMTKYIYHDKECQFLMRRLPGAYHRLVESKKHLIHELT